MILNLLAICAFNFSFTLFYIHNIITFYSTLLFAIYLFIINLKTPKNYCSANEMTKTKERFFSILTLCGLIHYNYNGFLAHLMCLVWHQEGHPASKNKRSNTPIELQCSLE